MLTFSVYALVGVDEQSTRHTSTPKGRFVLRADAIRPYSCGGKAADGATSSRPLQLAYAIYPTAQSQDVRAAGSRPTDKNNKEEPK